jgi:hypothetical protein
VQGLALGDGHVYVVGQLARGTVVEFGPSELVQGRSKAPQFFLK